MEGNPPEEDQERDTQAGGWLPPVPPGQEPQPGVFAPPPAQPGVFAPQAGAGGGQDEPPPPAPSWPPQPGQQPPQPGYGQQPGWGVQPPGYGPPPPPGYQQPGWQGGGQPPGWQVQPSGPGNGSAVTGFILSISATVLLFFTGGLSSVLSVGLAVAGTLVSRLGVKKVDEGQTTQHRGLGQAGFIIGIVGIVLSLLATILWIVFIDSLDEIFEDLEEDDEDLFDDDEFSSVRALLAVLGAAARLLL